MPDSVIKVDNLSGLTSPGVGLQDGSVSSPALKFTNDSDTGLYRIGSNNIGFTAGGQRVGEVGPGYGGFTGNVIQVQNVVKSDVFLTTSGSFVTITGLSINFATRYVNSKVLAVANLKVGVAQDSYPQTALFVNGNRFPVDGTSAAFNNTQNVYWLIEMGFNYLYTPGTTSSLTYECRVLINSGGTVYVNRYGADANRISSSSFTLLEVQQ